MVGPSLWDDFEFVSTCDVLLVYIGPLYGLAQEIDKARDECLIVL
jgi:hypothetical protein